MEKKKVKQYIPKSAWEEICFTDFKAIPLGESVKKALDVIRHATTMTFDDKIRSGALLREFRDILAKAIWQEMKQAIKQAGGPDVPTHVSGGHDKPKLLSIQMLYAATDKTVDGPQCPEEMQMVIVLARCACERISVIRTTLLTHSEDWWIRLLLNDIRSWLVVFWEDDAEMEKNY
ncbi:MAG TPA: hypothetical protein VGT78_08995 [Rhizomicrobium sp.]|nr:hypothetical protein [Rhizomicrobium sp.]